MANVASFVNTTRSRVTAYLKAMEDIVALQGEFNADGGFTFTDTFDFSGENASTYDMTQTEFHNMVAAVGQLITVFQGGAVTADATRPAALYKAKLT